MSSTQVFAMLKEKADLLKENDGSLFGKNFRDHVIETCKAKKKSLEAFSTKKQPFRSGPSYQGQNRGGRYNQGQLSSRGGYGGSGYGGRSFFKGQGGQAKRPYNGKCFATKESTQLQQSNRISTVSEPRHSKSCSQVHSVPLAGRLKHFLPAWEMITQDKNVLSSVEGLRIPFVSEPIQEKFLIKQK